MYISDEEYDELLLAGPVGAERVDLSATGIATYHLGKLKCLSDLSSDTQSEWRSFETYKELTNNWKILSNIKGDKCLYNTKTGMESNWFKDLIDRGNEELILICRDGSKYSFNTTTGLESMCFNF